MKLFIFDDVLRDYYPGMAVIIAKTKKQAIALAVKKFRGQNGEWAEKIQKDFENSTVEILELTNLEPE